MSNLQEEWSFYIEWSSCLRVAPLKTNSLADNFHGYLEIWKSSFSLEFVFENYLTWIFMKKSLPLCHFIRYLDSSPTDISLMDSSPKIIARRRVPDGHFPIGKFPEQTFPRWVVTRMTFRISDVSPVDTSPNHTFHFWDRKVINMK